MRTPYADRGKQAGLLPISFLAAHRWRQLRFDSQLGTQLGTSPFPRPSADERFRYDNATMASRWATSPSAGGRRLGSCSHLRLFMIFQKLSTDRMHAWPPQPRHEFDGGRKLIRNSNRAVPAIPCARPQSIISLSAGRDDLFFLAPRADDH